MHLLRLLPLALGAALAVPAQAQSLMALVESARSYDAPWQSAKAQLDAATSRAEQARAGLLPPAALSAGLSRANTNISPPAGGAQSACVRSSASLTTTSIKRVFFA